MRRVGLGLVVALALVAAFGARAAMSQDAEGGGAGGGPAAGPAGGVAALAWLAGSWTCDDGKTVSDEHWTRPAGGSMVGMSRTIARDRTVFHEFMIIEETDDGGVVMTVTVRDAKAGVPFKLVKSGEKEAVFENPKHDFPQRIIYKRDSAEALSARIEGDSGQGGMRGVDFKFKKGKLD